MSKLKFNLKIGKKRLSYKDVKFPLNRAPYVVGDILTVDGILHVVTSIDSYGLSLGIKKLEDDETT